MSRVLLFVAIVALMCLAGATQADVFNLGSGVIGQQMVSVGDPGNAGELSGANSGIPEVVPRYCGSVNYQYRIGKYEVTSAQYADFLNHKAKIDLYELYKTNMDACGILRTGTNGNYSYSVMAGWENRPVTYVDFWDACRFVNWLNNGQGNGSTEAGAYTLRGEVTEGGSGISRMAGAKWFLPSEDEWYKAAYYKGGGVNSGYWDFATQSDSIPSNAVVNPDPGNNLNYSKGTTTVVGEFENSDSFYGTFDQSGNVFEWNDTLCGSGRSLRGGSFGCNYWPADSRAWAVPGTYNHGGYSDIGFRVAAVIPEPSSLAILAGAIITCLGICRRKA